MNDTESLIAGALLAVIGGAISDSIHAWFERRRELKAIKIVVADELSQIESTVTNMHEVWEQTGVFAAKYVSDILACSSAYESCKPRLFLIKDKDLRKEVISFYKKLKDTVRKSEGKVGSLADTREAKVEQAALETSFQALGTDARTLRDKIE
ncbi:MAG TPA: hypothetical protein VF438_02225 [Candidatus Paceibacterota bacterium]